MTVCCFIRTPEWMEKHYHKHLRACVYPHDYCKFWRKCVEQQRIEYFTSRRLQLLAQDVIDAEDP